MPKISVDDYTSIRLVQLTNELGRRINDAFEEGDVSEEDIYDILEAVLYEELMDINVDKGNIH